MLLSSNKFDDDVASASLNDLKKDNDLLLFDIVKQENQIDDRCTNIRTIIIEKRKYYEKDDEKLLLKEFHTMKNTLFFQNKL